MSWLKFLEDGGFVMYPLLICSIIVWAISFEKIWFIFSFNKSFSSLYGAALLLLKDKKISEARGLYHNAHPLIEGPYSAIFETHSDKAKLEQKISRRLSETQIGLKRFLWILGTIGSSAPFIGLFGTVMGIIKSFDSMATSGKGGFSVVAADLSEALIATAAGIIVAVMAVMLYNYFQSKLSIINLQFKNRLEDLLDLIE
ncbi:MAG TPA: MotA/TolQ/ExbB proton channel family protein [Bacteriovoracaceae bacterium]|nr:MotA/TolQ/ExbB proton channel family protein [Bacteriovoracaceae bacterium]